MKSSKNIDIGPQQGFYRKSSGGPKIQFKLLN